MAAAVTAVLLSALACAVVGTTSIGTHHTEATPALLLPTIVSAFQNVYLAPFAHNIQSQIIQVLIIWNVIYSTLLLIVLLLHNLRQSLSVQFIRDSGAAKVIVAITIYGLLMMVANGNSLVPALASLRNLISPMLFLCLAFAAGPRIDFERYVRNFTRLGLAVIAVSIAEYSEPRFWTKLDLAELWTKKGIDVQPDSGLPLNFYASEQLIPGQFIRRMAGPFADPVNLGTFLFCLFCVSWYLHSRLTTILSMVTIALAVSKGGLLSLLVFLAVWSKKHRTTFEHTLAVILAAITGIAFLQFADQNSTGSVSAHTGGLVTALVELPSSPLGRGLGGTGVLSSVVSANPVARTSQITETGLGMVIGQLGIIGIALYAWFFTNLIRMTVRISDNRNGIMATSLAIAFLANCAFNEVALSPNSSAAYFIIIGLLVTQSGSSYLSVGSDVGSVR
jgi:hypothetical protein